MLHKVDICAQPKQKQQEDNAFKVMSGALPAVKEPTTGIVESFRYIKEGDMVKIPRLKGGKPNKVLIYKLKAVAKAMGWIVKVKPFDSKNDSIWRMRPPATAPTATVTRIKLPKEVS
jgi:hypothetical protein